MKTSITNNLYHHQTISIAISLIIGLMILSGNSLASQPWSLEPGKTQLSFTYLDEQFDEFFRSNIDSNLPAEIEQSTFTLSFEHGISDALTLEFNSGLTETNFAPATRGSFSGRDDSTLGIRWRFVDEYINHKNLPTLAVNVATIISGNYPEPSAGNPHSPGDGASGFSISLLTGKIFENGWILSGQLGYKNRESPVPSDIFLNFGAYYSLSGKISLSTTYRNETALTGVDIGDPGITPSEFDQLREIQQVISLGFNYQLFTETRLAIDIASAFNGRNTGKKDIAIFRYIVSF